MRIRVTLQNTRPIRIPIDHYDYLRGAVFAHLGRSDKDFAAFLHDEGYRPTPQENRRFKLFTFSNLRIPRWARRIVGDQLQVAPCTMHWFISSPREEFLRHEVTGLLQQEPTLRLGGSVLPIVALDGMPDITYSEKMNFTCLTPVVAAVPSEDRPTPRYLRAAEDAEALSEALRKNLIYKYRALHGAEPDDSELVVTWSESYLARNKSAGTKKVTLTGSGGSIDVIGTQAPLTLAGSTELIRLAYECGLGEKNSSGLGMLEVDDRG